MIQLVKGDITKSYEYGCHVIVNAANNHLRHGGGVAAAIARGAMEDHRGDAWWKEQEAAAPVPTGGAVATTAGAMPYLAVIHAVGPIWGGGEHYEPELLVDAYKSSLVTAYYLAKAYRRDLNIAFPAISTGIYKFPLESAAQIALQTVNEWQITHLEDHEQLTVTFVLFDDAVLELFRDAAMDLEVPADFKVIEEELKTT